MILGYVEFSMSWFPAFQHHTTDYIFRQVTYRFTFALFTFHIMMSLITLATDSCGRTFHETWYLTKTLLLIGSYVLVLCLEGSFWGDLGQWLPYLATAMFALEGVMFLFVAYDGNSVLVESERLASLLVLSGVFTVLSGFMLIYAYVHATHFDMVIVLIVATSMAGVSYGAALCLRCACERASLFVSSMVTFFISYVAWEAVMNYPTSENGTHGNMFPFVWDLIIGFSINLICFIWLCSKGNNGVTATELEVPLMDAEKDGEKKSKVVVVMTDADREDFTKYKATIPFFHIFMAGVVLMMAMLVTGWGYPVNAINVPLPSISIWWMVVSMAIVFSLYFWSIAAPLLFPDRDFD
mmetsp:Transcript_59980/g.68197  ORF Transcript_59980/g.68197 Transcript_59980/m.68197 type:complete len:353 (+) Transcript_59980:249-1307(+)